MRTRTFVAGTALAAITLIAFFVLWRDSTSISRAGSASADKMSADKRIAVSGADAPTPPPLPAGLSGLDNLSRGAPQPQRRQSDRLPPPPAAAAATSAAIHPAPSAAPAPETTAAVPAPETTAAVPAPETTVAPLRPTAAAPAGQTKATALAPPPEVAAEAPAKALAAAPPKPAPPPLPTPSPPAKPAPSPAMASRSPPDVVLTANVARMQLAAGMNGLEPGAPLPLPIRLGQGQGRSVYFFTELRGLSGRTVLHRWELNGRIVQERQLKPTSQAWRAYTVLSVTNAMVGSWRVAAIDAATGKTLAEQRFRVE